MLTRKYLSPYTFTLVFGKKGVGKSLSMQKDILKHLKRGWKVYADSNTHIKDVVMIDASKIHTYRFPRNSLIVIDEINLLWDNHIACVTKEVVQCKSHRRIQCHFHFSHFLLYFRYKYCF